MSLFIFQVDLEPQGKIPLIIELKWPGTYHPGAAFPLWNSEIHVTDQ